ncbi:substrate-binding domain-containing protein [Paractinoplanes rishiriensis]|uniref:substrate-binding domain-containing protein n=1 Tax=Paractinoplanes rishiriensis TaxID=1050105 RepID=UPI001EF32EA1|nr:substrate-binding domain-containing protein [Actinoplanes rishiriensis]
MLGRLVRPTTHKRPHRNRPGNRPRRLRREGAPKPAPLNSPVGRKPCALSAPGSPHGCSCNAAGQHGPPNRHPANSSNCSTPSETATPSTSIYHHKDDKLPLDNISPARIGPVPPTTVDQAGHQVGVTAARLLLERIADRGRPAAQVRFSPTLVVRASTAPPPVR